MRQRAALPAAVIAVIAVAIMGLVAVRHSYGSGTADPTGGALTSQGWALQRVVSPSGVATAPAPHSGISFFQDGRMLGDDGVNALSRSYHFVADELIPYGMFITSAVGYIGHDPAQLATITGLNSAFGPSRISISGPADRQALTIRTDEGWVLSFRGDGRLPRE